MIGPGRFVVAYDDDGGLEGDVDAPPVPWWSITKTCLAACALVLVDRGRLSLDAPIAGRPFTLRHLLQHTAGLYCSAAVPAYHAAVAQGDAPWDEDELIRRTRANTCFAPPGSEWAYSNVGYFLVRRLIEQTVDAEIGTALRTLVLSPLGIDNSRIAARPADLAVCAWGNPRGYHPGWVFHGLIVGPPAEGTCFA